MQTAKSLRDKFAADLKELQDNCPHPSYTVCEQMWAPGHYTGNLVTMCDVCEKVLKTNKEEIQ